jgi:hypothetical protein
VNPEIPPPRFEPRSGWASLPVQPPSGSWQWRGARLYPALVVNLVVFVASGFILYRSSAAWVVFWIAAACLLVQCVFFFALAVRAAQQERREREFGYTTWAHKASPTDWFRKQ